MTYILKIGDRRRLKAGIRVLHHTGHRAPCSDGRLNFADARRATSAQPSPSEEDTPSSKNGKAKETVHPCCKDCRKGKSVRELLRQPHTPLSSGARLRLRCPLRQGRPRRRGRVGPHPRTPGRDRAAAGLLGTTAADEQRSRNVAESTSGCASWPQRRSPTSNWATTSASPMSTTPSPFMAKRRGPKCMWRNAASRGHRSGPRLATFMRKGSPTGVRQRPVHRRESPLLPARSDPGYTHASVSGFRPLVLRVS